ncbi:MAG TPA: ABC transporter ATP-binding protein [Magnetospirillaceae bacterium]|nr:ABC transporter ATP-binding protein [Magnetospirillaceae bacterium]
MNVPTLTACGLSCGYRYVPVVRDVDLEAAPGELTVLAGPNGSGKTTLLRTLAGLLPPLAGEVLMFGSPVGRLRPRERARRIAYVPQIESPVPGFTVRQAVWAGRFARLGWIAPGSAEDERATASALSAVGLLGDAERPASELSGGEFRRLLIARALAQESPVLLLDEPEAHLDARHQEEILALLLELARGGAAIVATIHDLNLAALWADRIGVLTEGRLLDLKAPGEAFSGDVVERAFQAGLIRVEHPVTGRPQFLPISRRPAYTVQEHGGSQAENAEGNDRSTDAQRS